MGFKDGIPVALNGDTGIGKTNSILHAAYVLGRHVEITNAKPRADIDTYITKPSQDETHKLIRTPEQLVIAQVHDGIFF